MVTMPTIRHTLALISALALVIGLAPASAAADTRSALSGIPAPATSVPAVTELAGAATAARDALTAATAGVSELATQAQTTTDGELLDVYSGLPGGSEGTSSPGTTTAGTSAAPSGIDPAVREAVDAGPTPVIVRLREQVDMVDLEQAAVRAGRTAAATTAGSLRPYLEPAELARAVHDAARQARSALVVDTLQATARATQGGVRDLLSHHRATGGVEDVREYWIFNGFAATVDAAALDALAEHPDVASVTLDHTITLDDPVPTETGEPLLPVWSLERVNAPQVWGEYGVRGADVVIGVMDSGVDGAHPALADSWRGNHGDPDASWFVPTGENYPTPGDGHGHGTHVTGSIVGAPPGEVTGVAPDAQWIAAKIFTDFGSTNDSIVHAAFEWMLAPGGDPAAAPHVVNNSWGSNLTHRTEFWDPVAAWVAAGIVPVFANGNAGPGAGTVGSPASFPHSIGVGATDAEDRVAWFSSRGPVVWDGVEHRKPQVSAPGFQVFSTWPTHLSSNGYHTISGTSMAAPHVTGVVALLLSAAPDLSVDEVRQALESTARTGSHMEALPHAYGAGVVDAYRAVTHVAHSGLVAGTVTDSAGNPIEATVTAADQRVTADAATGAYALSLPAGDHELAVTAYGFTPQTHQVTVTVGGAVHLDLTLDATAEATLSGTVTGPDGPVADARVALPGTPVPVVRTGAGGTFQFTVAAGTYDLHVTAGGYAPAVVEVVVDGPTEVTVQLTPAVAAPGWAQYQNNPARTGRSGDSLAAGTLEFGWSAPAGGQIVFSSPVIADGTVFVNTDNGLLVAMDLLTGERLWTFPTSAGLRGVPAAAGGLVYTGGGLDGGIHAVDAATGDLVWTVETPGQRTIYTAPVVRDGVVYATTGFTPDTSDTLFAIDAVTGSVVWSVDLGSRVFFGPAVDDGIVVAASAGARRVMAVDATTGAELWSLQRDDDEFIAGPSIASGVVYLTTSVPAGLAPSFQGSVLAIDAGTGSVIWEQPTHGDGQGSTPAVLGDLVVAGSHGLGVVAAYDRLTGEPAWHYGLATSGGVSASALVSGDGYVVAGAQLDRRVFALDGTTGELVWEHPVNANVLSSAAYADGWLVTAGSNGTVHAFHPTGQLSGTVTGPDGPLAATVRVVEADRQVTASADTGAYEVTGLPPRDYTVEVSHYGFESQTHDVTVLVAQATTLDVSLAAVGSGALTGTVTDEEGDPLPGVTVALPDTPLEPAVTGDDGSYAFDDVAAGRHRVVFEAAGYADAEKTVTIVAGQTTVADATLDRFDVAVVADYEGRVADALSEHGWRVDRLSFSQVLGTLDHYQAVVIAGQGTDRADADLDRLAQIVAEADAVGTSLLFLDTGGPSYGSVRALSLATGDPVAAPAELSNRGPVWLEDVTEHPITALLPDTARVQVLTAGSWHAWYTGYSGHTLAVLGNDRDGRRGGGIGYQRRTMDSNHILLPAAAPSPWSNWEPAMRDLLVGAVSHAVQATYGTVTGQVTDAAGDPIAATVEAVGDPERTVAAADGSYQLLLEPGEHLLRFRFIGAQTVELPIVVIAGQMHIRDVSLPDSPLGTVAGHVTEQDSGAPITGATVTVTGTSLPPAVTGGDGGYVVEDVPGGTYQVEVGADGYETRTVDDVAVIEGQVTTLDVTLARAPGVVVVGDRLNQITNFLEGHSIPVEQAGWEVVDDLDGVEVVILHNPASIGRDQFLAALAAFDDAGVSVIFPADGWSTRTRGFDLLVNHTGNPPSYGRLGGFSGPEIYLHNLVEHPLFAGVEGDPVQLLTASSEAAFFGEYAGIRLADVALVDQEPAGIGMAYDVRTPRSVHVILSGLAATLRNNPEGNWTPDGQRIFLNAVRWAAAPGQAGISGTVTDAAGDPIPHAVVGVVGSHWRAAADADGVFEIGVPPGEHTLRYQAFGYVPEERTFAVAADEIADGSVQLDVGDVGTIAGVVSSSEGGVLAGARVDLLGTPYQTETADDGSYAFDLVEPGSYELELETDGHVRTLAAVEVVTDEHTTRDVVLRVSPRIGIIDDSNFTNSRDRGKEFLEDWGYEAEDIGFDSLDRIGDLDLVIANVSNFNLDPGFDLFKAFEEEINRTGVPVLWLGQHGRGAIQFLHEYDGSPEVIGEGFNQGAVTATVVEDHPLVDGLPDEFDLMTNNGRFTFFDEFEGTTVATLSTGTGGELGATIAFRGRTAGTVDVLLSTMTVTTWGAPSTRQSPALNWTPESERVLVNALEWALDAQGLAAEVRGTVDSDRGGRIASQVEVLETGRTYTGRAGDGTFLVPLQPGTWTLRVGAFGHASGSLQVTVEAGDVVNRQVVLAALPSGTVAGTITGPDGDAVAGAHVRLLDTPLSTTTGSNGGFSIGQVPEGDWTLRVTADGFRATQVPVTVSADQTTTVTVQMPATSPIAVVDTTGSSVHGVSLANMLAAEGYEVDLVSRANLAALADAVDDYELIIFNATLLSSQVEPFRQAVTAATDAEVSTIHASQFGAGYPIVQLSTWRGDPEDASWGFVSGGIGVDYVAHTAHPIFAGFPTGEQIELITSTLSNQNQQWGAFSGYSGQTLGHVHNRLTGEDLGPAVGFQFTSATSVEVLLGSLAAVTHGWPDERWTDNARQIYLNAVAWALDATQAELTGTVRSATDAAPVAGATVTALETGATGVTGSDGTYSLGLAEGDYTIRVSAFGFHTAEHMVEVPESGTITLDVDLVPLPRGEVTGTVTSTTGEPVAGATLTGTGLLDWSATTGANGGYSAGDLLEGEYAVTITADGFLPATASVTIVADALTTLDVTLQPTDVGVLGDVAGTLTAYLRQQGVPAAELEWDAELDLSRYRVVVVNGGSPDAEVFTAVLAAADEAETSLVFTGTWAVDRGGVRLLEQHTDRVTVGTQGYGDGPVQLTGFDPDHPLFAKLGDDPATLIVAGGYYSVLGSYVGVHGGWEVADLHVTRDDADAVTGSAVAWSWRTAGSVEVLLSASAVTEAVGPGLGWTAEGGQLLVNAITWAGEAQLEVPAAPTLQAAAPAVIEETVAVGGLAEWPSQVTVFRAGEPVVTVETGPDGGWSAEVPLLVGDNELTAVATNLAGDSVASEPITVARWVPVWRVDGRGDARVIRLTLEGTEPPSAPADRAQLVLRDADGSEAFRDDMQWAVTFYVYSSDELPPGEWRISAELVIEGFVLVIDGPELVLVIDGPELM